MAKRRKPTRKPTWRGPLPPLTKSIAEKLVRLGTIPDTEIARRMRCIGYPISTESVQRIRTARGCPAVQRIRTARGCPAVVERVKQLIAGGILNDTQIAARVKAEFRRAIPMKMVSDSRHEMRRPAVGMGTSKGVAERMQRVQTLRDQYARMPQKDVVEKWGKLTTTQSELKAHLRVPRIDKKKLLERIAEIEERREALFPLLPEEIRQPETEIPLERVVPVFRALARAAVELSRERAKREGEK